MKNKNDKKNPKSDLNRVFDLEPKLNFLRNLIIKIRMNNILPLQMFYVERNFQIHMFLNTSSLIAIYAFFFSRQIHL